MTIIFGEYFLIEIRLSNFFGFQNNSKNAGGAILTYISFRPLYDVRTIKWQFNQPLNVLASAAHMLNVERCSGA